MATRILITLAVMQAAMLMSILDLATSSVVMIALVIADIWAWALVHYLDSPPKSLMDYATDASTIVEMEKEKTEAVRPDNAAAIKERGRSLRRPRGKFAA